MPTELATDALAAYRLTRLLQRDTLSAAEAVRGAVRSEGSDTLVELYACPWCLGLWVSAAVALARVIAPKWWNIAARALACSAVVGFVLERVDPPEDLT